MIDIIPQNRHKDNYGREQMFDLYIEHKTLRRFHLLEQVHVVFPHRTYIIISISDIICEIPEIISDNRGGRIY